MLKRRFSELFVLVASISSSRDSLIYAISHEFAIPARHSGNAEGLDRSDSDIIDDDAAMPRVTIGWRMGHATK